MLSYSAIIKKAYLITIRYPSLWFFGMFVIGGFNLNFLHFENIPARRLVLHKGFLLALDFFQAHPLALAAASLGLLVVTFTGLVISNWARVMLILSGQEVLFSQSVHFNKQARKIRSRFWTVIQISMLTSSLVLLVGLVLFLPVVFLNIDTNGLNLVLLIAALIFLPLVFTVSCLNIFTTFYAVVYDKKLGASLNLGTDLFASRWTQILAMTFLLMVIYLAAFAVGVVLILAAREVFALIFWLLSQSGDVLPYSAILSILKAVSNVLLWFLLAGLSVFFNQALLILFFELNKPLEDKESLVQKEVSPAPSL